MHFDHITINVNVSGVVFNHVRYETDGGAKYNCDFILAINKCYDMTSYINCLHGCD